MANIVKKLSGNPLSANPLSASQQSNTNKKLEDLKKLVNIVLNDTGINTQELQNCENTTVSKDLLPPNGTVNNLSLDDLSLAHEQGLYTHTIPIPPGVDGVRLERPLEKMDDIGNKYYHFAGGILEDGSVKVLQQVDPLSHIHKADYFAGVNRTKIHPLSNLKDKFNTMPTQLNITTVHDPKLRSNRHDPTVHPKVHWTKKVL